eukprot:13017677-Alexandrium_andersonii.AAC.1
MHLCTFRYVHILRTLSAPRLRSSAKATARQRTWPASRVSRSACVSSTPSVAMLLCGALRSAARGRGCRARSRNGHAGAQLATCPVPAFARPTGCATTLR